MLSNEKVSLLFCFSINCVTTILFYLIFSVGTWCPEEGNSTKVYCIIIIINHDYDYNCIYIYIYNHS